MPDLSNSMYVARLRYIQSVHEFDGCRNPDWLVHRFFSPLERLKTAWMSPSALSELRSDPFYYYLIARTIYYDVVFQEAIDRGVRRIIGVGCGSDTRAFRFSDLLQKNGVSVMECDQQESVIAKQRIVRRWDDSDHVDFMSIDLNDGRWPALERTLENSDRAQTLVIMEGVSPYVDFHCFVQFLALLGRRLASGSLLAYEARCCGWCCVRVRVSKAQSDNQRHQYEGCGSLQFHLIFGWTASEECPLRICDHLRIATCRLEGSVGQMD